MWAGSVRSQVSESRPGAPARGCFASSFGFCAIPGLRIEISTPRTKTRSWGPRTWGTHLFAAGGVHKLPELFVLLRVQAVDCACGFHVQTIETAGTRQRRHRKMTKPWL